MLHQKRIVDRRDDGEEESGAEESRAGDPDPLLGHNEQEKNKEDRAHLRGRVGFAENTGAKVAQAGNHEEHATDDQDGDIAAEDHDRVFPGNSMFDRKHQKHCGHEELVGDRVKVLAQHSLLMQRARQQAIESVAQPSQDEQRECPLEIVLDQIDDDEGQKYHPQQGELIGRGEDLAQVHRDSPPAGSASESFTSWSGPSAACSSSAFPVAVGRNSLTSMGAGSSPVFCAKRWASDGSVPSGRSSSRRSMRCMGKNIAPAAKGSPSRIWAMKVSKEERSTPRMLRPTGDSCRIAPQNFSRGFARMAMTMAPARKGLAGSGWGLMGSHWDCLIGCAGMQLIPTPAVISHRLQINPHLLGLLIKMRPLQPERSRRVRNLVVVALQLGEDRLLFEGSNALGERA